MSYPNADERTAIILQALFGGAVTLTPPVKAPQQGSRK